MVRAFFAKWLPSGDGAKAPAPKTDVAIERWLIVGIGNPGNQYAGNRHNVGFWTVNRLARELGVELRHAKLASTADGDYESRRVVLAKPRTFVNESGRAVGEIMRRSGIPVDHLIVVYDELDLPQGQVRVKAKGGHGGHNGMRSIVGATGSGDFPRIRVGIGRPTVRGVPTWDSDIVASWVLGNPPPDQRVMLEKGSDLAAEAALAIIRDGVDKTMNSYNRAEKIGESPKAIESPAD